VSYNSLFRKAGRILKSYLNVVDDDDRVEAEKKKKIFDEYLRQEAQRRAYSQSHSYQTYQKNEQRKEEKRTNENKQGSPGDAKSEVFYYNVLGLKPESSIEEVKKSYKILMSQYHPDKVATLGIELQNLAKKKSQEINEAYTYIKKKRNF
jgi:DnaJ like chaperone protein